MTPSDPTGGVLLSPAGLRRVERYRSLSSGGDICGGPKIGFDQVDQLVRSSKMDPFFVLDPHMFR